MLKKKSQITETIYNVQMKNKTPQIHKKEPCNPLNIFTYNMNTLTQKNVAKFFLRILNMNSC